MAVQRIWKQHNLKPHLVKTFKLSRDQHFLERVAQSFASQKLCGFFIFANSRTAEFEGRKLCATRLKLPFACVFSNARRN